MALLNPSGLSPVMIPMTHTHSNVVGANKDSRWLTLEVCREFARSKCSRSDEECKYAHPPPHVEIQNGRVTCCFDSIKSKCQRKEPACKYLHPPQHLREILLLNGRQNLIAKNFHLQATMLTMSSGLHPVMQIPGFYPTVMYDTSGSAVSTGAASAAANATGAKQLMQGTAYPNVMMPAGSYFTMLSQGATSHPYLLQPPATYQPYFTPVNATSSINGGYPALLPAGLDQSSASAAAAMLQMAVNSQANDQQRGAAAKYYECTWTTTAK